MNKSMLRSPVLHDVVGARKSYLTAWCIGSSALLVFCLVLVFFAQRFPWAVEQFYSRGLYPLIAHTFGRVVSLLPISLFELLLLAAVGGILFFIGLHITRIFRHRRAANRAGATIRAIKRLVVEISLLLSIFILFCGLNYYRPTYAEISGLIVRDSSAEELIALCAELTDRANELAPLVTRNEAGVAVNTQNAWEMCRQSRDVFGNQAAQNKALPDLPITPKPILLSGVMSMTQISGFFCPITFEANVNVAPPDFSIPFTICHELAHTRGFMREDEANFIGYLACRQSERPEFAYSGAAMALIHVKNRLYTVDPEAYWALDEKLSEQVLRDYIDNDQYWTNYEGVVAEVSSAVNDTYLQLNSQRDGVQSYGRMVDLLLADYRQRHGLE